jgi:glycosyltransferase involved in cell wall biosynthesis
MKATPHAVSVVIPVYGGEHTLPALIAEIQQYADPTVTSDGHEFVVSEVLLVFDHGPDDSARVIRELKASHEFVRVVWMTRNFGQHAATLAGMASSGGDWIVTLDEDGQHDPSYIGVLLDTAMREQTPLVYAKPTNPPSHGFLRNIASRSAKRILSAVFTGAHSQDFQSYRLILGSVGRGVAAYAGSGVYLDVALSWVAPRPATAPVPLRAEGERTSGYSFRRLLAHFWRMVLTSGTRGLRFVTFLGVLFALLGIAAAIVILIAHFRGSDTPQGWASMVVVVLLSSGAILFSLGIVAEYLGVSVNMSLGKPPYMISGDPLDGPLGRPPAQAP